MNKPLSNYFSLNRRYNRSINLERDLDRIETLEGYILTDRAVDAAERILTGLRGEEGANRAWTLTSVYGTGKSAFARFLAALCAKESSPVRQAAVKIADEVGTFSGVSKLPQKGLFRAVATAQREPISYTIIRALANGAELFWRGKRNNIATKLFQFKTAVDKGELIEIPDLLKLVKEVAESAKTGVILVIDELGKNLEYAVRSEGAEDLYLLQQLAEMPTEKGYPVYLLGILHQSFSDYGERLATVQRNEWTKIQGRFEDIPFADSPVQMMRLIGNAIDRSQEDVLACPIANQVQEWMDCLGGIVSESDVSIFRNIYPLHPLTALVLPALCNQYAQNDRSLFTFLTSAEPYSFRTFLEETRVRSGELPTLKLDRLYDYFVESVGMGMSGRLSSSRWIEIQGLIVDARYLDTDSLRVLKTIGILNLVTTTGELRATKTLVTLALCDRPDASEQEKWETVIDSLLKRNLITHFKTLDELRIWQGSDFNVEAEIQAYREQERATLASLLSELYPLKPLVAQRHSYRTGTLRYFERQYLDAERDLTTLKCSEVGGDGFIGYWLDEALPVQVPERTADGKPLMVLRASKLGTLRIRTLEYAALQYLKKTAPQLQTDAVARREVNYRLGHARRLLHESVAVAFGFATSESWGWIAGRQEAIASVTELNGKLSQMCDRVYPKTPILWNELINRRELTSQGSSARRQLIEAMLEHSDAERLGRTGYGPEVSMYYSVLAEPGIHREEGGEWGFYPPPEQSGLRGVWDAIAEFCLSATEHPKTLDLLYQQLGEPPYGMKPEAIPVLLAAFLLHRIDDIGVYREGAFIPVLGSQHFDLLVRYPDWFAVKHFEMTGLRSQVFKELESVLSHPRDYPKGSRNTTLLTVIAPLLQFERQLPTYTQRTQRVSPQARAVLNALQTVTEPDELLFTALPKACELPAIDTGEGEDGKTAKTLRKLLGQAFRELQAAYDSLLREGQTFLYQAFGVRQNENNLREDLRVRASRLLGRCIEPMLNRFILAAVDETAEDRPWLEAMLMIVADKPTTSWTDEDVTGFEVKLSDLARRFKNLEALQAKVDADNRGQGFEARKITVTRPDGREMNEVVWIEHESEPTLDQLVEEVLNKPILHGNPKLQQAFIAKLSERVFGAIEGDNIVRLVEREDNDDSESDQTYPWSIGRQR